MSSQWQFDSSIKESLSLLKTEFFLPMFGSYFELSEFAALVESSFDELISSRGFSFQDGPGIDVSHSPPVHPFGLLTLAPFASLQGSVFVATLQSSIPQQRYKYLTLRRIPYCVGTVVQVTSCRLISHSFHGPISRQSYRLASPLLGISIASRKSTSSRVQRFCGRYSSLAPRGH